VLRVLLLAFVPIFVAIDVIAVVVIYLGMGTPLDEGDRCRLVTEATLTAAAVGVGFLLAGDAVLQFLGISVGDFQIAGGILLLVLSIHDLLHPDRPLRQPGARPGVVPLGTPMIAGPAVLPTLLTVARTYGYAVTLAAFALNLLLVWAALRWAVVIGRLLGEAGAQAVTKVFSLILAAIAVTFVRHGVLATVSAQ
jgi:multiple antibiotic resistance protein